MKTFTHMAAQGDFVIIRVNNLPKGLVPLKSENGKYVVAHSETGHNHVMTMDRVQGYKRKEITDDTKLFELFFSVEAPTEIQHLRTFDTHETLLVPPGKYIVKRQREYVPEGFRKAAD